MFGLGPATKVFVATGAVDMRKGFEGLYGLVRDELGRDPLSGHLFLFANRSRTRLKMLFWDGSGLWVCAKLSLVLEHGELELSNNLADEWMRGVALGRKNWIHMGSSEAGPKEAASLSVNETAKRLGMPVRDYLLDVLPGMAGRKVSAVAGMTPQAWAVGRKLG